MGGTPSSWGGEVFLRDGKGEDGRKNPTHQGGSLGKTSRVSRGRTIGKTLRYQGKTPEDTYLIRNSGKRGAGLVNEVPYPPATLPSNVTFT